VSVFATPIRSTATSAASAGSIHRTHPSLPSRTKIISSVTSGCLHPAAPRVCRPAVRKKAVEIRVPLHMLEMERASSDKRVACAASL